MGLTCSGLSWFLMPFSVGATKGVGMTISSSSACLMTAAMSVLAFTPSGALWPCRKCNSRCSVHAESECLCWYACHAGPLACHDSLAKTANHESLLRNVSVCCKIHQVRQAAATSCWQQVLAGASIGCQKPYLQEHLILAIRTVNALYNLSLSSPK